MPNVNMGDAARFVEGDFLGQGWQFFRDGDGRRKRKKDL